MFKQRILFRKECAFFTAELYRYNSMLSALKAAWIFYSTVILVLLILLFTLPSQILTDKTPLCTAISTHNTECSACGLTRGFTAISEGRFDEAQSFNEYSAAVFSIFFVNTSIFLVFGIIKIKSNRKEFLKIKRNKSWLKQV